MTLPKDPLIIESEDLLIEIYEPQPIALESGNGVYIYDTQGNKYLDCSSGIGVASLGHAHPAMLKTINEQAGKLFACQADYVTKAKLDCAKLLINKSCLDMIYFGNSGTEAVEAALKIARKWSYDTKGEGRHEIITFHQSFHGRTMGSASVTHKRNKQPFFAPYLPGVHFASFNDLESVREYASEKTAAIIVEPVQGEGGLIPANPCFLQGLRALCDKYKIALIFDEVQAGMGRLGTLYAYESFSCCGTPENCDPTKGKPVEPDLICIAKGMGSGFPVGAVLTRREFGEVIDPGAHGTTFGGNPLATAVAHTVVSEISKPAFLENIRKISKIMFDGLKDISKETGKIEDIRGMGLMIGIDTTIEINKLRRALQKNGLLTTQAGERTLRLMPPLIFTEDHAQEALGIVKKTLIASE